jgi:hypothetical protein
MLNDFDVVKSSNFGAGDLTIVNHLKKKAENHADHHFVLTGLTTSSISLMREC